MKIVAMKEKSDGNETVGNSWIETAIFDETSTLAEVLSWAARSSGELSIRQYSTKYGRLMLSVADEPTP